MDLTAAEEAVKAASSRVVGFGAPSKRVANGLGHAIVMGPDLDGATPPTADELDTIVQAIWENAPWEPNAIRLVARDADTGEVAVDLRDAADELAPMRSGPFGDRGVTLTDMAARYGEWEPPE